MPKMGSIRTWVVSSSESPAGTDWGFPMSTQLLLVIMTIVALHVAVIAGGGLALGIMRLLGRAPDSPVSADERESIP